MKRVGKRKKKRKKCLQKINEEFRRDTKMGDQFFVQIGM